METFYGKYRGKVVNNIDPLQLGRLQVQVPAVAELPLSWAMPCVPYAGNKVGWFALPPIGANVWVEFEEGDANYPIWTGCFWGKGEVPAQPAIPTSKVLQSEHLAVRFDDLKRELTLEVSTPAGKFIIAADTNGIQLDCRTANLTITHKGVEIKSAPSKLTVQTDGIKLEPFPRLPE